MLLDQPNEKKKITLSGNNQLLKGAVFAVVSLCWFCFLFAFVNMEWDKLSPFTPFHEPTRKEDFLFYFICFSFFITTLIFSTIFYRNNLQPTDLLLRFGVILLIFLFLFVLHLFFRAVFSPYKVVLTEGLGYFSNSPFLLNAGNIILSFLFLYFIFFPVILFFSKIFFNGFFGLAGYVLSFIITAVFYLALYGLADLERKLDSTLYPMSDIMVILFFTLISFGVGVSSGEEEKRKRPVVRLNPMERMKGPGA